MQKGAVFNFVSSTLLIGLNIKFYEIFAKQLGDVYYIFLTNFLITKSLLSQSNPEILREEHVKL